MARNSLGVGEQLKTEYPDQVLIGTNNEPPTSDIAFLVADGTKDDEEHNSLEIYRDGRISSESTIESNILASNYLTSKESYIEENVPIDTRRIWVGTSDTAAGTRPKVVTTISGDFVLQEGALLRVTFDNETTTYGYLDVDGSAGGGSGSLVRIIDESQQSGYGPVNGSTRTWVAGQEYLLEARKNTNNVFEFWEIEDTEIVDETYEQICEALIALGWDDVLHQEVIK